MNPLHPLFVRLRCSGPGIPQGGLCLLCMSLPYFIFPFPHQEGMVDRPEFVYPVERRDKVPLDHKVFRPVRLCGPSWVGEGDPGLFDRQTSNRPPRDLRRGPLKEVRDKHVPQRIFYRLKGHPYVWGDALHEGPLLLKGLLQACVCVIRLPTRHPNQGGH